MNIEIISNETNSIGMTMDEYLTYKERMFNFIIQNCKEHITYDFLEYNIGENQIGKYIDCGYDNQTAAIQAAMDLDLNLVNVD